MPARRIPRPLKRILVVIIQAGLFRRHRLGQQKPRPLLDLPVRAGVTFCPFSAISCIVIRNKACRRSLKKVKVTVEIEE